MTTPTEAHARRGEIWAADFEPVRGHEQGGRRPVLVVSVDSYNRGPLELVIVAPLTSRTRRTPVRVLVEPPEGGLRLTSAVMVDQPRTLSRLRLVERWGAVSGTTMTAVERGLRGLLGLSA